VNVTLLEKSWAGSPALTSAGVLNSLMHKSDRDHFVRVLELRELSKIPSESAVLDFQQATEGYMLFHV